MSTSAQRTGITPYDGDLLAVGKISNISARSDQQCGGYSNNKKTKRKKKKQQRSLLSLCNSILKEIFAPDVTTRPGAAVMASRFVCNSNGLTTLHFCPPCLPIFQLPFHLSDKESTLLQSRPKQ